MKRRLKREARKKGGEKQGGEKKGGEKKGGEKKGGEKKGGEKKGGEKKGGEKKMHHWGSNPGPFAWKVRTLTVDRPRLLIACTLYRHIANLD